MKYRINVIRTGVLLTVLSLLSACESYSLNYSDGSASGSDGSASGQDSDADNNTLY